VTASTFWAGVGAQLRQPEGWTGRLAGHAMRLANARANALAVKALAPRPGEHIAELGCGPGQALRRILAQDVALAIGIDHSPVMLAQARSNNARDAVSGRLSLQRCDFAALPLGDASIDAVLAVNVAYFMHDATAIAEACRVLKPGGRLVLYATSVHAMRNWRFACTHSHRLFDEEDLRTLLRTGGLSDADIEIRQVNAGFGIQGLLALAQWQAS